jgi:hypothetical protein
MEIFIVGIGWGKDRGSWLKDHSSWLKSHSRPILPMYIYQKNGFPV